MELTLMNMIVLFIVFFNFSHASLPPKAQALIDSLPEKKITLSLVLSKAMESSESFKIVDSQKWAIEVPRLRAQSLVETRLKLNVSYLNDKTEATPSPFALTKNITSEYSLGLISFFKSGTAIEAAITHGLSEFGFQNLSQAQFYETKISLGVSQNLWKDAWGYGTRRTLEAGEIETESNLIQHQASIESWILQMVDVFYQAWFLQLDAISQMESQKRKERLLRVTQVKWKRGTAEEQDYLQVKSAFQIATTESDRANLKLNQIWRELVYSLKFPEAWLEIDPKIIPMAIDHPIEEGIRHCKENTQLAVPPPNSIEVKKLLLDSRALDLRVEASRNSMFPDLKLNLGFSSNGIDPTSRPLSMEESLRYSHPLLSVGVTLTLPLSNDSARSDFESLLFEKNKKEALLRTEQESLKIKWKTLCSDLYSLEKNHIILSEALKDDVQRRGLEQKRFEVGRGSTTLIIQAEDDASMIERRLRQSDLERRLIAWNIRKLLGIGNKSVEPLKH